MCVDLQDLFLYIKSQGYNADEQMRNLFFTRVTINKPFLKIRLPVRQYETAAAPPVAEKPEALEDIVVDKLPPLSNDEVSKLVSGDPVDAQCQTSQEMFLNDKVAPDAPKPDVKPDDKPSSRLNLAMGENM